MGSVTSSCLSIDHTAPFSLSIHYAARFETPTHRFGWTPEQDSDPRFGYSRRYRPIKQPHASLIGVFFFHRMTYFGVVAETPVRYVVAPHLRR